MDKIAVFSTDLGSWGRPVDRIAIFSTDSGAPRPRSRKDNPSTCDFSAAALDPPAKPVEKVAVSSKGAGPEGQSVEKVSVLSKGAASKGSNPPAPQ